MLESPSWRGCFHSQRLRRPHLLEPASIYYLIRWLGGKRAHQTAAHANVTKATLHPKVKVELQLWGVDQPSCLCSAWTFNSRWSSKYGLQLHYAHWRCNSCAKNLPFSVALALSGAKADDLIGRDWNQLWHLLIVYSCCITAAPGCAGEAPASVFYPPPRLNRGQEPKTGFEDYFTEQLKLLLLRSICCWSLRIAEKPSFKCLIWNHTEMNCHFWFHAQAFSNPSLSVFKFRHIHSFCLPTIWGIHTAIIHQ